MQQKKFVEIYLVEVGELEVSTDLGSLHARSEVLRPKIFKVNLCNLSRLEHGSWDLPLHMVSQV